MLHQRMIYHRHIVHQNTVPSLVIRIGGPPSPRFSRATSRPAAHVPPSSTLASGNCSVVRPSRTATRGAISSSNPTVRARQPTIKGSKVRQRRALSKAPAGSRGTSTAVSMNRPPLRYSASPVSPPGSLTPDAGGLQRFNQRISQPLRSFSSGTKCPAGVSPRRGGYGQQSPSAIPSSVGRFGQIAPQSIQQHLRMVAAGMQPTHGGARRAHRTGRPVGGRPPWRTGPDALRPRRPACSGRAATTRRALQRVALAPTGKQQSPRAHQCRAARRHRRAERPHVRRKSHPARTSAGWPARAPRTASPLHPSPHRCSAVGAGPGIQQHRGDRQIEGRPRPLRRCLSTPARLRPRSHRSLSGQDKCRQRA